MNDPVTKASHAAPRHLGVRGYEIRGDALRGLSEDLQIADDGILGSRVREELSLSTRRLARNTVYEILRPAAAAPC